MQNIIKIVLLLALVLSSFGMVGAQSEQLSSDQVALLARVRAAFEGRENWTRYSENLTEISTLALTISGGGADQWQTDTVRRETVLEHIEGDVKGTVNLQVNSRSSDGGQVSDSQRVDFEIAPDAVLMAAPNEDLAEVRDPDTLADFGLEGLFLQTRQQTFTVDTALLDQTNAIFDMGLRRGVQRYALELDLLASLPLLKFDLENFLAQFEAEADLEALEIAFLRTGELRLEVALNAQTGQLQEAVLILDVALELSGAAVLGVEAEAGLLALTYGWQQRSAYYGIE